MEKDIYKLKLHEYTNENIGGATKEIERVAGGWIYSLGNSHSLYAVFVPFDNEFQQDK